jgi:hypothetical protein
VLIRVIRGSLFLFADAARAAIFGIFVTIRIRAATGLGAPTRPRSCLPRVSQPHFCNTLSAGSTGESAAQHDFVDRRQPVT